MKKLVRLIPLLALAASGCVSIGTFQTAHTVGDGELQFAVESAFEGVTTEGDYIALPRLDFSVRHGLTDRIDIGGRAGASGLELMTKFQFTDPANRAFALSVAPSVGGLAIGGVDEESGAAMGLLNFNVPVLIGIGLGESGSEITIGPKFVDSVAFLGSDGDGGAVSMLSVGASLGVCISFGRFKLLPEFSIVKPVYSSAGWVDGSSTESNKDDSFTGRFLGGGAIFQGGLGFLFGGR